MACVPCRAHHSPKTEPHRKPIGQKHNMRTGQNNVRSSSVWIGYHSACKDLESEHIR